MRQRKVTFEELVEKNKQELKNDKQAMEQIEHQIETRQMNAMSKTGVKKVQ